ncbi:ABC transporter substrate-binding protein [Epidermidibacterium keratini]|uniref:ABC transporter substrate-binding protein n=1 Tax=Epidermidibacterium keratini TaxID=1891644 RepID=A0A7L4YTS7_9ACTN|nr:ABC transporter substrate-binding protein [Epidermidibacterium keratini]
MPAAILTASGLLFAGYSASGADDAAKSSGSSSTIEIEDNSGSQTVATPPSSVVALDNRTFETLASWDIELSAAAVSLMPDTISYTKDDSIIDIGTHNEPDLEAIVAAEPDLVINGQRFTQHEDKIAELVPDATIVNLEPREGEPFTDELIRQTTTLGEIFGKQDEAQQLVSEFESSIKRVQAAYDSSATVMAVTTTGGEIGYIAPSIGRTLGPLYDTFGLTPALEVADGGSGDQGDDISVEAIASSNPDWILVMDRDAAIAADDPSYSPAADVLEGSAALANVTAVQDKQIVYMPADTYTNESIQTYTEFFNAFADALEATK